MYRPNNDFQVDLNDLEDEEELEDEAISAPTSGLEGGRAANLAEDIVQNLKSRLELTDENLRYFSDLFCLTIYTQITIC